MTEITTNAMTDEVKVDSIAEHFVYEASDEDWQEYAAWCDVMDARLMDEGSEEHAALTAWCDTQEREWQARELRDDEVPF